MRTDKSVNNSVKRAETTRLKTKNFETSFDSTCGVFFYADSMNVVFSRSSFMYFRQKKKKNKKEKTIPPNSVPKKRNASVRRRNGATACTAIGTSISIHVPSFPTIRYTKNSLPNKRRHAVLLSFVTTDVVTKSYWFFVIIVSRTLKLAFPELFNMSFRDIAVRNYARPVNRVLFLNEF